MKTAEFVSPRHPDKMCDQISDAILDYCLKQDSHARVAVETMGGHGKIVIMGEVTINGELNYDHLIEIAHRIAGEELFVEVRIVKQSIEIANGVDDGGAGDQGIMIGYACRGNSALIPQEEYLARSLNKYIFEKHGYDGKTQITLNDDGEIETIVTSFQNVSKEELLDLIRTVDGGWLSSVGCPQAKQFHIYCNPAGDWNQGGFDADTGLTGRKLMVDNYGPNIPIGGGAFSGKDATKVDRSAAYMARYIAVDMLDRYPDSLTCLVKIAYAIGKAEPVMVTTEMTFKNEDGVLESQIVSGYDLTPQGIIEFLELDKPQYEETARWGHFGNGFKWDKGYK